MTNKQSDELVRLKRVLLQDSIKIPNGVLKVLKNDLNSVLGSYFEILPDSTDLEITVDENGVYDLTLSAKGTHAKKVKTL